MAPAALWRNLRPPRRAATYPDLTRLDPLLNGSGMPKSKPWASQIRRCASSGVANLANSKSFFALPWLLTLVLLSLVTPFWKDQGKLVSESLWESRKLLPMHSQASAALQQSLFVDFQNFGERVPLEHALTASFWSTRPIYCGKGPCSSAPPQQQRYDTASAAPSSTVAAFSCPTGEIRVFVAIMTRGLVFLATESAKAKRNAIRATWMHTIKEQHSDQMYAAFIVSQPAGDSAAVRSAAAFLQDEVLHYGDIAVVPSVEHYRELPAKTLRMLGYALSSPCNFTHILKSDDDDFLRPAKLLELIEHGQRNSELDIQAPPYMSRFDGRLMPYRGSTTRPWMQGVYVGKIDGNRTGIFPGFYPDRNPVNKWFLDAEEFPDSIAPLGVRWASGWGYLMSADVALFAWDSAVKFAAAPAAQRPLWWGVLPWEDVVMAAILRDGNFSLGHHQGFKAAWEPCDENTVLKHLDSEAPKLTVGLQAQEDSGLWGVHEVVCSSGSYLAGDYEGWRSWRNSLPDVKSTGYIAAQREIRSVLMTAGQTPLLSKRPAEQTPWWHRFRWLHTSREEAVAAQRSLLSHVGARIDATDIACGPGADDYMHTLSGGTTNAASPQLVYVPGYGAGTGFLFRAMAGLAAGFRFFGVDPLGTGLSGRPHFGAQTTEEAENFFVDSLEKWREAAGVDNFVLMGHSMGGYISAIYALRHPERIKHLILVCPAGFGKRPEDWQPPESLRSPWSWKGALYRTALAAWNGGITPGSIIRTTGPLGRRIVDGYTRRRFRQGHHLSDAETESFADYMYQILSARGSGEFALRHFLEPFAFPRAPLEDRLQALQVPVTFIYGEFDWMNHKVASKVAAELQKAPSEKAKAAAFSHGKVVFTPNSGHYPFIDQPGVFLENVLEACGAYLPSDAAQRVRQAAAKHPFRPQADAAGDTKAELEAEMKSNPAAAEAHVATDL